MGHSWKRHPRSTASFSYALGSRTRKQGYCKLDTFPFLPLNSERKKFAGPVFFNLFWALGDGSFFVGASPQALLIEEAGVSAGRQPVSLPWVSVSSPWQWAALCQGAPSLSSLENSFNAYVWIGASFLIARNIPTSQGNAPLIYYFYNCASTLLTPQEKSSVSSSSLNIQYD